MATEAQRRANRKWRKAHPESARRYVKKWRAANKNRIRESTNAYRAAHREETRAASKAWREKNTDRVKEHRVKTHYGLSGDEYQLLWDVQDGVCAICRKPETAIRNGKVQSLSVDHDHMTGRIRGLLCQRCNNAIGQFKEDVDALANAIVYLKRSRT